MRYTDHNGEICDRGCYKEYRLSPGVTGVPKSSPRNCVPPAKKKVERIYGFSGDNVNQTASHEVDLNPFSGEDEVGK